MEAPKYLSKEAKKEFQRLSQLREFRPDELDRLAEYAHTISMVHKFRKQLIIEGEVLISPRTNAAYTNPTYNHLVGMQTRMDKLRDKLFPALNKEKPKKTTIRDELL